MLQIPPPEPAVGGLLGEQKVPVPVAAVGVQVPQAPGEAVGEGEEVGHAAAASYPPQPSVPVRGRRRIWPAGTSSATGSAAGWSAGS